MLHAIWFTLVASLCISGAWAMAPYLVDDREVLTMEETRRDANYQQFSRSQENQVITIQPGQTTTLAAGIYGFVSLADQGLTVPGFNQIWYVVPQLAFAIENRVTVTNTAATAIQLYYRLGSSSMGILLTTTITNNGGIISVSTDFPGSFTFNDLGAFPPTVINGTTATRFSWQTALNHTYTVYVQARF